MTNWLRREIDPIVGAYRATRGLRFQPGESIVAPSRVLAYKLDGASRSFEIDVYLPAGEAPAAGFPSVFLVHGGGFAIGSKRMKPTQVIVRALVSRGFAAFACSYPLTRGRLTVLEQARWVTTAIDRAHREGAALAFDPARRYGAGFSAGATLLLLAEASAPAARFATLAGVFGLYDFEALRGAGVSLFKRLVVGKPASLRDASPLYAPGLASPLLLLHGTADLLVPIEQARAFAERRRAAGLPVELVEIDGAEHAFFNDADSSAAASGLATLVRAFGGVQATPGP
jgi:acetyl esterase/lipase